jgi:hypothetical protein
MVFQFKIEIKNISAPPVWRRIQVPSHWSFDHFHQTIQAAFGWENNHLYMFSPNGWGSEPCIGSPLWQESECRNADKIRLRDYFQQEKQKIVYIYDFGDDWLHNILLEKILDEVKIYAELVDGRGKCPPEDCGGSFAYMDLKEILRNPEYPDHDEIKEFFGISYDEMWDPAEIDLTDLKNNVHKVR